MTRTVLVDSGGSRYGQDISIGPHALRSDEPGEVGGDDAGPNPYELLMAALGACTSMTVKMYAARKQWPLQGVHVEVSYARVHADDCAECETDAEWIDGIDVAVSLLGNLSDEQRSKLIEIANRCPIHRTLTSPIPIRAREGVAGRPPS